MPINKQMSNDINYWFDFDDQDIMANRQGQMTSHQLDNIRKDITLRRYLYSLFGTAIAFFLTVLLINHAVTYNLQWLVWLALVMLLVAICLIMIRNLTVDHPKSKNEFHPIYSIQGQVRLYSQHSFGRGRQRIYRVRVDNRLTFHVSYQQWQCFEDGAYYALYYSVDSFRILSLEKIPAIVNQ